MRDLGRWSNHNCIPTLERGNEPHLANRISRVARSIRMRHARNRDRDRNRDSDCDCDPDFNLGHKLVLPKT